MHFVYKTDNLFRSIRVSHGNSSVTKRFQFLNLFELHSFFVFKMHHSKPHHQFSNLSDLICYFSCIYKFFFSYKTLKLKSISNELWKGWKLAWYHHFIHIVYARKLRGLRQKLDALCVQNGQSLSKYQGFIRKLVCYKGISFFELIWTPDFLCVQNAPFKATSSIFNPFWLHLLFFMHLLLILSYKTLKLKSISNELWKGWKVAWYHHFTHIACARK